MAGQMIESKKGPVYLSRFDWKRDWKELLELVFVIWFADDTSKNVGKINAVNFLMHYMRQATDHLVVHNEKGELLGLLSLTTRKRRPEFARTFRMRIKTAFLEWGSRFLLYWWPGAQTGRLFNGRFFDNYHKLRLMVPHPDSAEFLLLIVAEQAQGSGVGNILTCAGEELLCRAGVSEYFLLTDTSCNYGFYDYLGMTRVVDVSMDFGIHHVPGYNHYLNCFLHGLVYVKHLPVAGNRSRTD